MKKIKINRIKIFLLVFCLLLPTVSPALPVHVVEASSWTSSADNDPDIYGKYKGNTDTLDAGKEGTMSKLLAELLTLLGKGFEFLFSEAGILIDNIVYGRVNGNAKNGIAMFTFELNKGNPYGLVGASIYQVFRMISYAILSVVVIGKLSFGSFKRMTPQNLEKSKTDIIHLAVSFLALAIMPYLLDLVLYLRDIVLYIVTSTASNKLFGSQQSFGLTKMFRDSATSGLTSSIVYVAAVAFSLYLAFLYVGYAMSFTVCFAAFPLVVIMYNFKPDLIKNWISTVSYFILVPIMDAALLLLPAFLSHKGYSPLITLLSCLCLISSRSILAQLLGIQDKTGGVMGMAAMMMAGRMVGSIVGAGKKAIGDYKGARSDEKMAQYEEEMAANEAGGQGPSSNSSSGGGSGDSPLSAQNAGIENYSGGGSTGDNGLSSSDSDGMPSDNSADNGSMGTYDSDDISADDSAETPSLNEPGPMSYEENLAAIENDPRYDFMSDNEKKREALRKTERGQDKYEREQERARTETAREQEKQERAQERARVEQAREQEKQERAQAERNAQSIADRYATVDNFESGPLNNQISHAKKAEMYRERAKMRKAQSIGTAIGAAGGALVGASAGLMMGPVATSGFAAVGASAGSSIGGAVGSEIGRGKFHLYQKSNTISGTANTTDGASTLPASYDSEAAEQLSGTVDFTDLPATQQSATVDEPSYAGVTRTEILQHMTDNRQAMQDCDTRMNQSYTDNAQEMMEPVYQEMKANNEFAGLDSNAAREKFRDRVHQNYMTKYNSMYDSHPSHTVSSNPAVETAFRNAQSTMIRRARFSKDNHGSFISDKALDSYSWFDL